ncbi:hypothetical protein D9M71_468990 [compost metagenome]
MLAQVIDQATGVLEAPREQQGPAIHKVQPWVFVEQLGLKAVQPAQQPACTPAFDKALDVLGQQLDRLARGIAIEQVVDGAGGLAGIDIPTCCHLPQPVGVARKAPRQGLAQIFGEQAVITEMLLLVVDWLQ